MGPTSLGPTSVCERFLRGVPTAPASARANCSTAPLAFSPARLSTKSGYNSRAHVRQYLDFVGLCVHCAIFPVLGPQHSHFLEFILAFPPPAKKHALHMPSHPDCASLGCPSFPRHFFVLQELCRSFPCFLFCPFAARLSASSPVLGDVEQSCGTGCATAGRFNTDNPELDAGRFRTCAFGGHQSQDMGQTSRGKAMHRPGTSPTLNTRTPPTAAKVSYLQCGPCVIVEPSASQRARQYATPAPNSVPKVGLSTAMTRAKTTVCVTRSRHQHGAQHNVVSDLADPDHKWPY